VDQAESEADLAFRVNRDGAGNLASAAAEAKAALIHISTDYVFDGAKGSPYVEDDPPNPLGVYGESKLAGEVAVREALAEHCIVRPAWLYGIHGKSFPRTMLSLAQQGKPLRVVSDQIGCPTFTRHLSEALAVMAARPVPGTYHAVNSGECSWYELAQETLRGAELATELGPISTAEYPTPVKRPADSRLDTGKLHRTYGHRLPDWREGVAEFVKLWREETGV
jgi:dTDP-4-dehydrorhamnose reductase